MYSVKPSRTSGLSAKISRALGILTPVVFACMMDKAKLVTGLEREVTQKAAKVEYHVLSLGMILLWVWYGLIDR